MQCHMYTSIQITTTEQNTVYWHWIWHVPKCKCLNRFKSVQIPYFNSLIITVCRQSKQKFNSRIHQYMQLARSLQKTKYNCHKIAALARLCFDFRGKVLEASFLLSRAERGKQGWPSAMQRICKNCPAHQNREENVNKNVKSKPFPSPATAPKIWSGRNQYSKFIFYKINEKLVCANVPSILQL